MIGHALPVYQGYASQYGHGLGNILGGLVRSALPVVSRVAKAAGAELLKTGIKAIKHKKATRHRQRPMRATPILQPTKSIHKRKGPPGKRVSRKKTTKRSHPRDIFA